MKKNPQKSSGKALKITLTVLIVVLAAMLIGFTVLYVSNKNSSEISYESDQSREETEDASLSSLFIQSSESQNLLVYSGDVLEGMSYPEFIITDYGLLFYESNYSESDENYIDFTLLDPQTGLKEAEAQFNSEFLTDIKQTGDGIIFADSSTGSVYLLDETLNLKSEYSFEANYEYWYISTDGKTLYKIEDGSLLAIDLESSEEEILLSSSVSLYGSEALNGGSEITYIDEDQLTQKLWLDFENSSLSQVPFDEAVNQISVNEDIWLVSVDADNPYDYIFGAEDEAYYVSFEEGSLSQVENCGYLLYMDDNCSLCLYDTQGNFISSCEFSDEDIWFYSNNVIYSTLYDGIFILAYYDGGPVLYFWDLSVSSDGENLTVTDLESYEETPGGVSAEIYLYERAALLSEEYGIEILIADQCETVYEDFTAEQISDTQLIKNGLDILENALSKYPDNFISQLKYDNIRGIQINLMGTLTPVNDNWGEENYNGFTQEEGALNVIVFDLNQLYVETVYHEISHIIDNKLEWDAYCRQDALFSEETWESLNPDGFEYLYVYSGFTELEFDEDEYLYFIDIYSMISPTEDRARIMEYAMAGYDLYFTDFEPTMAKLAYYAECIRDAFDTAGWEEVTAWEEVLN